MRILLRAFEDQINLRDKAKAIYDFGKLVLFILYIGHFTGCLFYFLADWENYKGHETNWLRENHLEDANFID